MSISALSPLQSPQLATPFTPIDPIRRVVSGIADVQDSLEERPVPQEKKMTPPEVAQLLPPPSHSIDGALAALHSSGVEEITADDVQLHDLLVEYYAKLEEALEAQSAKQTLHSAKKIQDELKALRDEIVVQARKAKKRAETEGKLGKAQSIVLIVGLVCVAATGIGAAMSYGLLVAYVASLGIALEKFADNPVKNATAKALSKGDTDEEERIYSKLLVCEIVGSLVCAVCTCDMSKLGLGLNAAVTAIGAGVGVAKTHYGLDKQDLESGKIRLEKDKTGSQTAFDDAVEGLGASNGRENTTIRGRSKLHETMQELMTEIAKATA